MAEFCATTVPTINGGTFLSSDFLFTRLIYWGGKNFFLQ
jgi:hypothetical protein